MNEPEDADGASRHKPLSTSRRLALAIYGVALIFVIVAGFRSIIPPIFWPEVPAATDGALDCQGESAALETTLLDRAAEHMRRGGDTPSATPPAWLGAWDARFHTLRARCPSLPTTSLERLRFRLERTLWRFDRNEGRRVAELRKLAADSQP